MPEPRIIAVGLLTFQDLERLGPAFDRAWPVDETPCFAQLLAAIDEADRQLWKERDSIAAAVQLAGQPLPCTERTSGAPEPPVEHPLRMPPPSAGR